MTYGSVLFVAALAVLGATVLWAVYRRSSGKAVEMTCASNVRQLGTAIVMYCMDNGGRLPPYTNMESKLARKAHSATLPTRSEDPLLLRKALALYTSDPAWFCPLDQVAGRQRYYLGIRHEFSSYAVPEYVDRAGRPMLLADIPVDTRFGLVWDAAGDRSSCEDNLWFAGSQQWASNHPDGTVNFVLQDLSVHRLPAKWPGGGILP